MPKTKLPTFSQMVAQSIRIPDSTIARRILYCGSLMPRSLRMIKLQHLTTDLCVGSAWKRTALENHLEDPVITRYLHIEEAKMASITPQITQVVSRGLWVDQFKMLVRRCKVLLMETIFTLLTVTDHCNRLINMHLKPLSMEHTIVGWLHQHNLRCSKITREQVSLTLQQWQHESRSLKVS